MGNAEIDQQVTAGQRSGPGARTDHYGVLGLLADHAQAVEDRRVDADRRAVLIVVEHRYAHAFLELGLDLETFRRLDVFEIDGAEGGLQAGHRIDEFINVEFVDLDVEHVDAGEGLEQAALAFHDRFRGEGADGAEAEHGGSVGNHPDQIGPRGVFVGIFGIAGDLLAGNGDARRIGQGQIILIGQGLGRMDTDFAWLWIQVIVKRCLA